MTIPGHDGFTVLEAVLYTAVVALLVGTMGVLLSTVSGARARAASILDVESQGAFAMEQLLETVRNAGSISAPTIGTTGTTATVAVDTAAYSPTSYSISSGTLFVTRGSGAAQALTNSHVTASDFSVRNLSRSGTPGTLRVQFTLSTLSTSEPYYYQQTFYGTASLR